MSRPSDRVPARLIDLVVIFGTAAILYAFTPPSRSPTGDAPHLLAIARRLVRELFDGQWGDLLVHWSSLLAPHPPGGYVFPVLGYMLAPDRLAPMAAGCTALALIWHGMALLSDEDGAPLGAWLLLIGSPMTWLLTENLAWDLLCAGCVAATIGHLRASEHLTDRWHALAFGGFMGLGFMTKYTFPMFLVLPTLYAGVGILLKRRMLGLGVSLVGFGLMAGPWYAARLDRVIAYITDSVNPDSVMVDATSKPMTVAEMLQPEALAFYPSVLLDAIGWPGLILVVVFAPLALRRPGGRLALLGALGGLLILSFTGQRQARYLFPALPLLLFATELGFVAHRWLHWFGGIVVLGVGLPALICTASTSRALTEAPPSRDYKHTTERFGEWGSWPWPETPFLPVSSRPDEWRVDAAIYGLAEVVGREPQTVGVLLYDSPHAPDTGMYLLWAESLGMPWDVATVKLGGMGGQPQLFVAPFVGDGWPRRDFAALYAVSPAEPGGGEVGAFCRALGGQEVTSFDLPDDMVGTVYQIPDDAWQRSPGRELMREPMPPSGGAPGQGGPNPPNPPPPGAPGAPG